MPRSVAAEGGASAAELARGRRSLSGLRQAAAACRGCDLWRIGVLTLEQLHFADEILPTDEIEASPRRVGKEELAMARRLIESTTTAWKPEKYRDTYRDQLAAAIEAKRKGKAVRAELASDDADETVDLLEALRWSIARAGDGRRGEGRRGEGRRGEGALDRLTKAELERRAREAGIEGRSKMSKDELVAALGG